MSRLTHAQIDRINVLLRAAQKLHFTVQRQELELIPFPYSGKAEQERQKVIAEMKTLLKNDPQSIEVVAKALRQTMLD